MKHKNHVIRKLANHSILSYVIMIGFVCMTMFWNIFSLKNIVFAQTSQSDEAQVRFIFTTDIHGQLNSKDYEQGVDYNNGGLARAYDLICKARKERAKNNSFTFDVGDVMYDYTTEYIFAEDQKVIQPIYKAMYYVGYDAVTLGNHDFEYGFDYIKNQLKGSKLYDKVVLSNVMDSKTGDYPFSEYKLITREVETTNGRKAKVTIGVIGETIPTLSEKTEDYTGVLKTEDIVANVKAKAAKVRELGADIVVVLAHSGIGPEDPELNFKNVSYALTKIEDVDVVLCGHEHNTFPTTDKTSPYYKLKGVDRTTGLVNGKNLVMANDRGKSIGIVDLTIDVDEEGVMIIDRTSEVRAVSENDTTENKTIRSLYGDWEQKLLQYTNDVIGTVKEGEMIQNYYGMLQDNNAIQLMNNARRSYAMRIINTESTKYKEYPVIAASTYGSYGVNSYLDFTNIQNDITESDLASIQPYNNYTVLYKINGKQLKEWLEWSASAYESTAGTSVWSDITMSELMKSNKLKSLVKEDWMSDWSSFYVFDGIDYTMDPLFEPRYDISGNKINNTNRVKNVTYNGKTVTDSMVFILAVNKITHPTQANQEVSNQAVYKKFYRSQVILSDYVKMIAKTSNIVAAPDYNWKLILDSNYKFILRGPSYADSIAKKCNWYDGVLKSSDTYDYYSASYPEYSSDKQAPTVIMAPTVMEKTGKGYDVIVTVTDSSGIKTLKYIAGDYNADSSVWTDARILEENEFQADKNSIYTVYAEDNNGNKAVKKIKIDNINNSIIEAPKVKTYTNRKSKLEGSAEPGTTVVIETAKKTYKAPVNVKGNFSYKLPAQNAGSTITIYATDETGRTSDKVIITVKRTGPNQPLVSEIYNNSESIIGNTGDEDAKVIVIMENTVYVPLHGGKELYENSELYDPDFDIVEVGYSLDKDYDFILQVPPQQIGYIAKIYSIDHINRVSRLVETKVKDGGPNPPEVYEISNMENTISGQVTSSKKNTIFQVYAMVNGQEYQSESDEKGYFHIELDTQLKTNQEIKVFATDTVKSQVRVSAITSVKVLNIDKFTSNDDTILALDGIMDKDDCLYGSYEANEEILISVQYPKGNVTYSKVSTDEFGDFEYELTKTLPAGTRIYAIARFSDGGIIDAVATEVILTKPVEPYLLYDITNNTKTVKVVTDSNCEVIVKIGKKNYKSSDCIYDKEREVYVYTVLINRTNSGTTVHTYASNKAGTSQGSTSKIKKTAPDSPKVKQVYTDSSKITGSIELFDQTMDTEQTEESSDDNLTTEENEQKEDTSNVQSDKKISKAKKTQTTVYARIGNKIYKGIIKDNGYFTIKIKKCKLNSKIYVWGENKGGKGPITTIIVKEKLQKEKK